MQSERAKRLEWDWKAKGNSPCEHPQLEKEYLAGLDTGDLLCSSCGETASRPEWDKRRTQS